MLEGVSGKNTDKEGMVQEGRQRSGVFMWYIGGIRIRIRTGIK